MRFSMKEQEKCDSLMEETACADLTVLVCKCQ